MNSIQPEHFMKALLALLDESFEHVQGFYLDRNNSLFETLATISAAEASIPVGGKCATLAAQVKHIAFYLEVYEKSVGSPDAPQANWGAIWSNVGAVSAGEWESIQNELRANVSRIHNLIETTPDWPGEDEIGNAMAVIAHTAYHLGEIRQALCTLRK
jgi:hypothetical protein